MAVCPLLAREQALVGRVVLVNEELVGKIKANTAERISLAWWLKNVDRPVAVMLNPQPDAGERIGILPQGRPLFVSDNRRRNVPSWIDRDKFHLLAQQRSGHGRLADYDLRLPDDGSVSYDF